MNNIKFNIDYFARLDSQKSASKDEVMIFDATVQVYHTSNHITNKSQLLKIINKMCDNDMPDNIDPEDYDEE